MLIFTNSTVEIALAIQEQAKRNGVWNFMLKEWNSQVLMQENILEIAEISCQAAWTCEGASRPQGEEGKLNTDHNANLEDMILNLLNVDVDIKETLT